MEMKDRVVVVTGAGQGLGKSISEKFFAEGATVALWDKDEALVRKTAQGIDPTGKRVLPVGADVTDEPSIQAAVQTVLSKFGAINAIVNNAGISRHKPIHEMSVELFEAVLKVDLTGVFICCKAVTEVMKKQGGGKIVNIASLSGRTGRPGVGVNYAAAKAGVIGITQTLAREVGPYKIYVNAIAPGPILTEQTRQYPKEVFAEWNVGRCIPKDGMPEDVADAAIFLASSRSDWVTGVTIDVNGGILIR